MIRPRQQDLFAVIGNPIAHSLSPVMMNAAFRELGHPALYMALESDALEEDLDTLWKMGFRGVSVTLPHKESAFVLCSSKDETAGAIGAVNTLRREAYGWAGKNTDWLGSNRALESILPLEGKRALVLGAGGAARAVVYGLIRSGAEVHVSNRTPERGEALAKAFGCEFLPFHRLQGGEQLPFFHVVVQCTSVGLTGGTPGHLVPQAFFQRGMVVMDTVYRPLWTDFLRAARDVGSVTISGIEMLVHQGIAQLEWWLETGPLPSNVVQAMHNALVKALCHE
ncbi:MAG: shikimate dehydrogenase [Deltaproteobacteria bacterium]|nr:shikimate dehydrogenase [Deltaproteobacteria bacterium]